MATVPEDLSAALEHHRAGHLAEAEKIYQEILAIQPNHLDAIHLLGVIATQRGQYEVAIRQINRAISLGGRDPAYFNNLGEAYREVREFASATTAYRNAIALNPTYALAHYNLGVALDSQQMFDEAVASFERAVQLNPTNGLWQSRLEGSRQAARKRLGVRVAVCMSGTLRSFEHCWPSIRANLLGPLEAIGCVQVFAELPLLQPFDITKLAPLSPWLAKVIVTEEPPFSDASLYDTRLGPGVKGGSLRAMRQMWGIRRAFLLSQEYAAEHGFHFDWVVRARYDTEILSPIGDLRTFDPKNLYIPPYDNWWGYNDRFAIGSPETMDVYSGKVDHVRKFWDEGHPFHLETFLKYHLDTNGVSVQRMNVHVRIVRSDGTREPIIDN
jgi:tetratricopeptide (TPR) repeat protein